MERQALVALYKATDGEQWKNHTGWNGAPGTECDWYGIVCNFTDVHSKSMAVVSISLDDNNLRGSLPPEMNELRDLNWLSISGNRLTGILPQPLIDRWLAGPLTIAADAPLLTEITSIDYEWSATSLLCGFHRISLQSDGEAARFEKFCTNRNANDRTTYCEVKKGKVIPQEFARLAWLMEKYGYFSFAPEYDLLITHGAQMNVRVTRGGRAYRVNEYAGGGPLELWGIHSAIEGVAANVEWSRTTRQDECPVLD